MSYRMLLIVAGCGLLALFPLAADALGQNAATSLVARIMIYAIAAASLNLILGYGGMVSFGHAAFSASGRMLWVFSISTMLRTPCFSGSSGLRSISDNGCGSGAGFGYRCAVHRRSGLAHIGCAIHHDNSGLRADAVFPVRFTEDLWWRRRHHRAPGQ